MSVNEFHQVRILSPGWEGYSLEFQCPLIWTVNQIKCYITYISPRLQFHQFEITFAGKVLIGGMRLQELVDGKKEKDKTVLFLSSKPAEKFEQYYTERMKKFFDVVEQEMKEMHPTTDEYSLEGVPVLCSNFNATLSKVMQHGRPELDNLPPINNANPAPRAIVDDGQDGQGPQLGGIIDRGIVIGVLWISWMQGSYLQIVCICALLGLHEFVTRRRNRGQQQNIVVPTDMHPLETSKRQRAWKRLWFRLREFFYCYFMSMFPNWNVQKDYLEKFRQEIDKIKRETEQPVVPKEPTATQTEEEPVPEVPAVEVLPQPT